MEKQKGKKVEIMARNKTEKMTISFENQEIIKKMVGDIAQKENRSLSAIIEKIILERLLPKDRYAKWIVEQYLYSNDGGIGKTLEVIFANNSAGVNWRAVHSNMLPLVCFASTQEVFCNSELNGDEVKLNHTIAQVRSVLEHLNRLSREAIEQEKKIYYKSEIDWGTNLLDELKNKPKNSRLINFYQLILNNWEDLKDWTITYRLLSDLANLESNWSDTPEVRMELLQIVKDISQEW